MMSSAPSPSSATVDGPAIALDDVVAVLGQFPALAGASLTVERGEIVLLRGPNGAGKTTLLRLCAGLLPVERGTATILGFDLSVIQVRGARAVDAPLAAARPLGVGVWDKLPLFRADSAFSAGVGCLPSVLGRR
jgi:energy-coupling factor transporter ATP-binding protein EcfA2